MTKRLTVAEFQKYNRPKPKKLNLHFITRRITKFEIITQNLIKQSKFQKIKLQDLIKETSKII